MADLYLIETRARNDYSCLACGQKIPFGSMYFRHDPFPAARQFRGQKTSHWCRTCVLASDPGHPDFLTGRLRVPDERILHRLSMPRGSGSGEIEPVRFEIVGIGHLLSERLTADPTLVHHLSPAEFEEFICDRLFAMGLEPRRVGATNQKDGGVDVIFWPRARDAFPFLGAAQLKHHRDPRIKVGPSTVREFAGAIAGHPFGAGIIVTNTSFTPDAEWYAGNRTSLIRLRDFSDIRRWLTNNFHDEHEWREIPSVIELCPGVVVKTR